MRIACVDRQTGHAAVASSAGKRDREGVKMRIVSWNMGCGGPGPYGPTHENAWNYLLEQLQPDVALVQESKLAASGWVADRGSLFWGDHWRGWGTGIFVRKGLSAVERQLPSEGSFVAAADVGEGSTILTVASIHVAPTKEKRRHLQNLIDVLFPALKGRAFVAGGDFNAARSYGQGWFFAELAERGLHDCHWDLHGQEGRSFWGQHGLEAIPGDYFFVDAATGRASACYVVDNEEVRRLSDHGPVLLHLDAT